MVATESDLFKKRYELAKQFEMEIKETLLPSIDSPIYEKVPYAFVKRHLLLPIEEDDHKFTVAVADPLNIAGLDELRLMVNKPISAVYANETIVQEAINKCYHHKDGETKRLIDALDESKVSEHEAAEEGYDLLDVKDEAPIIRLLNLIIGEAIEQGASDIHFEPYEKDLKVRYRIDGVLQNRHSPPAEYQAKILTRIKVMAKLDIAEHRLPQDGRIKLKMGGREIDFRVSTVPTTYGERIVLRILDRGNVMVGLEKLGMLPSMLDQFKRLISLSEGIVLVTGPTGSGKTTTLYSALSEIYSNETNIMTIEDPVEYKLKGVAQIGVHPKIGLTFATGLRHILRQDPDIVMVGEIRDAKTAEIAIQASLTGHLVMSTLHTNDAPSAVARLVDMGIEPYLLSSSLAGVLAQRLVRTICSNCRTAYEPTKDELQKLNLTHKDLTSGKLYCGKGCSHCFGSGYKGRHGIYELLTIDPNIENLIAKRSDTQSLRHCALDQKQLVTLRAHGAHLVKSGVTTVKEVLRVTRNHENGHASLPL